MQSICSRMTFLYDSMFFSVCDLMQNNVTNVISWLGKIIYESYLCTKVIWEKKKNKKNKTCETIQKYIIY